MNATYILDFNNLKIKNQQVLSVDEFQELIAEDTEFMTQFIQFDSNGVDVVVDFTYESSFDIAIKSLIIDSYVVELNKQLVDTLKLEIKKQLI